MPDAGKTFSESWYRVSGLKLALRPRVRVRRQFFRGEKWFVLQDPFNNQFYRLKPAAHAFVVRLRPDRTVDEVWKQCLELDPDSAPGQEDVIRLLAQLYQGNLLQYDLPADSVKLLERYSKRRQREVSSRLLNIMFARFPLLDPDEFLKRALPIARWVLSPAAGIVWLVTVVAALKLAVENWGSLVDQSQGVLLPQNLFLLYIALIVNKGLHEFGHAFMCRKYGGEVHTMGVMLLIFTPVPYVDATSSWAFRSRRQRILVAAAGMIVELFVASLATFACVATGDGILHSLAYNMMFIASVSTVLFNGNPLLRYDGYYILSDLIDVPNLAGRALLELRHLVEFHVFGVRNSRSEASSRSEAAWLVFYAVASGLYRLTIFTGIIFFVADRMLLAGLVMAVVCVVSWGIVPSVRLVQYFVYNQGLARTRLRAAGITCGMAALVILLLNYVPFPNSFKAPGILRAAQYRDVTSDAPGMLAHIVTPSSLLVKAGQPLVVLENPEISFERAMEEAKVAEAEAELRRARINATADLQPLSAYLDAARKRLDRVRVEEASLTIRAPIDGRWAAPKLAHVNGAWIPRGGQIGWVIKEDAFEFMAVVSQQRASGLFGADLQSAEVKLRGQADRPLRVKSIVVVPGEQRTLPSPVLGWQEGGEIKTDLSVASGLKATEPFFQVLTWVEPAEGTTLLHGCSGRIRFKLPREPLMRQWLTEFRQMLQRRYHL